MLQNLYIFSLHQHPYIYPNENIEFHETGVITIKKFSSKGSLRDVLCNAKVISSITKLITTEIGVKKVEYKLFQYTIQAFLHLFSSLGTHSIRNIFLQPLQHQERNRRENLSSMMSEHLENSFLKL